MTYLISDMKNVIKTHRQRGEMYLKIMFFRFQTSLHTISKKKNEVFGVNQYSGIAHIIEFRITTKIIKQHFVGTFFDQIYVYDNLRLKI